MRFRRSQFSATIQASLRATVARDDDKQFSQMQMALDINDASWLVRSAVLGQIEARQSGTDGLVSSLSPKAARPTARHP